MDIMHLYVHIVWFDDDANGTQRSYLDAEVQQLTTTVLGREPVKNVSKAQITYVRIHSYNRSRT